MRLDGGSGDNGGSSGSGAVERGGVGGEVREGRGRRKVKE